MTLIVVYIFDYSKAKEEPGARFRGTGWSLLKSHGGLEDLPCLVIEAELDEVF